MYYFFIGIFFLNHLVSYADYDVSLHASIEIKAQSSIERSKIANLIHIDYVWEDRVFSVISLKDYNKLLQYPDINIINAEILYNIYDNNKDALYNPYTEAVEFPLGDEKFHTYDEMYDEFNKLALDYPHLVTLFSIGKSYLGKDIWAIKITYTDPLSVTEKPASVFMGTHHAREHVSTEMPILFAHDLVKNFATDEKIKEIINKTEVYIIPMVNPDGAMYDISKRKYKMWRKNRKNNYDGSIGVDLNRNYSYRFGKGGSSSDPESEIYRGKNAFSETETSAIKDFFTNHKNISTALSFHTYSELILYPWSSSYDEIKGDDIKVFMNMANHMALSNKYRPMQSSELYVASGETCDWVYDTLKAFCFTFELSPRTSFAGGFYPGASIIDTVYSDNLEPMLYLAYNAIDPYAVIE